MTFEVYVGADWRGAVEADSEPEARRVAHAWTEIYGGAAEAPPRMSRNRAVRGLCRVAPVY